MSITLSETDATVGSLHVRDFLRTGAWLVVFLQWLFRVSTSDSVKPSRIEDFCKLGQVENAALVSWVAVETF